VKNVLWGERDMSTCGMDVAKWERARERNGEKYEWRGKGAKMDERVMEEEGKDRKRKRWEIGKKRLIFGIVIFMFVIKNPKSRSQIKLKISFSKFRHLWKILGLLFFDWDNFPLSSRWFWSLLWYRAFKWNPGWKRRWNPSIVVLF
jgi:hypothetical protein